jgi:hypothetical protein
MEAERGEATLGRDFHKLTVALLYINQPFLKVRKKYNIS